MVVCPQAFPVSPFSMESELAPFTSGPVLCRTEAVSDPARPGPRPETSAAGPSSRGCVLERGACAGERGDVRVCCWPRGLGDGDATRLAATYPPPRSAKKKSKKSKTTRQWKKRRRKGRRKSLPGIRGLEDWEVPSPRWAGRSVTAGLSVH